MNKSELVSRLADRFDGDRAKAAAAVNGVLEEIEQSLARGEKVSLFGFGTFDRRERGPRAARNPATGETIQVGASVAPVFRAGAGFKQALARATGTATATAAAATVAAPVREATKKDKPKAASKGSGKASKAAGKKKAKAAKADTGKAAKGKSGKGSKK